VSLTVSPWRAAAAAGILAILVALPAVRNGFVLDDTVIVENRRLLRQPPSIGAVVAAPYWPGAEKQGYLWRPAVMASYALDYRVSASPHWFHAVNALWAGLAAAALTLVVAGLFGPRLGLVTGLLFAVHPVHVEATANVVGRAELMAAAGYGAALLLAAVAERRRWLLVAVALAAALAIGSKEHAATLPAAVLLLGAARSMRAGERWQDGALRALMPAVVAAFPIGLYFAFRADLVGTAFGTGGGAPGFEGLGAGDRIWAMVPITLEWWRLLFFPLRLSADYSPGHVTVVTGFSAGHALALMVWAAAGACAWRCRHSTPGASLGFLWIVLTILPASNLIVPLELVVAERTLFLPSLGAALILAATWEAVRWPPRWAPAVLALAVLAGGIRSVARAGVWKDEASLVAALEQDAPRSAVTLWFRGQREFREGRWGSGERLLREAMVVSPNAGTHIEDLASAYASAGVWPPVVTLMRNEMSVDSGYTIPWALLPMALLRTGDTAAAARLADNGARRFSSNPMVLARSIDVLVAAGWCRSARWSLGRLVAATGGAAPDTTQLARRCAKSRF
jgi:protein O-mannosyl-transferase